MGVAVAAPLTDAFEGEGADQAPAARAPPARARDAARPPATSLGFRDDIQYLRPGIEMGLTGGPARWPWPIELAIASGAPGVTTVFRSGPPAALVTERV